MISPFRVRPGDADYVTSVCDIHRVQIKVTQSVVEKGSPGTAKLDPVIYKGLSNSELYFIDIT